MRHIIAGSMLLVAACAPHVRETAPPTWAKPAVAAETTKPAPLQGKWSLNESLSDDPQPLIRSAVDSLRKSRRAVISGRSGTEAGRRVRAGEGYEAPGRGDPYGDAAVSDPRLAALRARTIAIEQQASELRFTFDDAVTIVYSAGQATSEDQNINLTFADWEGSQFVVEKNGPDGLVVERWILSPAGSQLYLAVSLEVKLPDFPLPEEPLMIGRLFDRIPEADASHADNSGP